MPGTVFLKVWSTRYILDPRTFILKNEGFCQAQWHTLVIPRTQEAGVGDYKFEATLNNLVKSCHNKIRAGDVARVKHPVGSIHVSKGGVGEKVSVTPFSSAEPQY